MGDNNNKRTQPCRNMCSPAISPGSESSPVFLPWVPVSVEAGVVGAAAPSRRPVSAPPSNAPPTVSRTSPPTTMPVLATVTAMPSPRTISACWPTPSLPTVASARSISALMPRLPWPVFGSPPNLEADFFFRFIVNDEAVTRFRDDQNQDVRDLVSGFTAGYNRYVREILDDGHAGRHADCRNQPWLAEISEDDLMRRLIALNLSASSA